MHQLRSFIAMVKQMLSVRGRFHRKILLVLIIVMAMSLLRQGGGQDGRHYPPEAVADTRGKIGIGAHLHLRDNRELQRYQNELLQADANMTALELLNSDSELSLRSPMGKPAKMELWIEVEKDHLPVATEPKTSDSESFERPLAVTLDTSVMTNAGKEFLYRLQSGKSRNSSAGITIMTINYKVGALFDARFLLESMGVNLLEYSFSEHCGPLGTCFRDLSVINADNAMTLTSDTVAKFYQLYREDELFERVDAFLCVYPSALCELFIPFNKSIVIWTESRYDIGRLEDERWKSLNDNLMELSRFGRKHFIRSSNAYDSEYLRYFTDFAPRVLAPACSYVKHSYDPNPSKQEFLLMPIKQMGFQEQFLKEVREEVHDLKANVTLVPAAHYYPDLKPSNLVQHPAIVLVPHQVSYISLTEYHRMGIPVFVPSMELLCRWHLRSNVVFDKTWNERRKWQKRHRLFKGTQPLPNANDESSSNAIGFWLMFSDYYYQPYFNYYTSAADLARKLDAATRGKLNLTDISVGTQAYARTVLQKSGKEWERIVKAIRAQKKLPR